MQIKSLFFDIKGLTIVGISHITPYKIDSNTGRLFGSKGLIELLLEIEV